MSIVHMDAFIAPAHSRNASQFLPEGPVFRVAYCVVAEAGHGILVGLYGQYSSQAGVFLQEAEEKSDIDR